jgi:hypothetical protein
MGGWTLATKIFLHGHGTWKPDMGYTQVPKGCSIVFYTHFAKLLNATMVRQILGGTYVQNAEELEGRIDRRIGQYKTAPNLRISSLTAGQLQNAHRWFSGTGAILHTLPAAPPVVRRNLDALMDECIQAYGEDLEFHWLCCQALGLTRVGGRALGVNASDRTAQVGREGYYLFKWNEGGVPKTKWVKSHSTIHQNL